MQHPGGKHLIGSIGSIVIMLAVLAIENAAALDIDDATAELLVEAVTVAERLDLYNAGCRSDVSGRQVDNLNKVLVARLRITRIGVQDELFPERSYREAQKRLKSEFLAELRELGGCKAAKRSVMPERLRERYRELIERIESMPRYF